MIHDRLSARWVPVALILAALFLGCAMTQKKEMASLPISYAPGAGPPESYWPDPVLKATFERYWATRLAGQWEETWNMEAPYFREMASKRRYGILLKNSDKKRVLNITLRKAVKSKCRLYEIPVKFSFRVKEGNKKEVYVTDRWVKVSGQWHHVMRDPVFFPGL